MICAPKPRSSSGLIAFTVAWVPTGMKIGVWTGPRRVWTVAARAPPCEASSVKEALNGFLLLWSRTREGEGDVDHIRDFVEVLTLLDSIIATIDLEIRADDEEIALNFAAGAVC